MLVSTVRMLQVATVLVTGGIGSSLDAQQTAAEGVVRIGMCDASAASALGDDRFLVACDEDNTLRIYARGAVVEPLQAFDANGFLRIDPDKPEADIEGAAAVGNRIYWITSHGRNKEGKLRPNRYRFFATQWERRADRTNLFFVGSPNVNLLDDLLRDPRLARFNLSQAASRAPKSPGALNIEGLCATRDGTSLLIGFRNPVSGGKSLIVALENPGEAIDGGRARFGEPMQLDLGGLGIRSLDYWKERDEYLIVAGDYDESRQFAAYLWSGSAAESPRRLAIDFGPLNPEGVVIYPGETNRFQIVSDDGTKIVDGLECKESPDARRRSFRTAWFGIE